MTTDTVVLTDCKTAVDVLSEAMTEAFAALGVGGTVEVDRRAALTGGEPATDASEGTGVREIVIRINPKRDA